MGRQGGKRPVESAHGRAGGTDDDDVVLHFQLLFTGRAMQKRCPAGRTSLAEEFCSIVTKRWPATRENGYPLGPVRGRDRIWQSPTNRSRSRSTPIAGSTTPVPAPM